MASVQPSYNAMTNAVRPPNGQSASIFGTIDYTAKDIGQWQSDGSVIINFASILQQNPGFLPQSIIITNPNGDSLAVSINPGSFNYRISMGPGTIARDLCPAFTTGLSVQFGALTQRYIWAPVTYMITNFPLVPEQISLWKVSQNTNSYFSNTQFSPANSGESTAIYTNSQSVPVLIESLDLEFANYFDFQNEGSVVYQLFLYTASGSTGPIILEYFSLSWDIKPRSKTFQTLASGLVLMPKDELIVGIATGSPPNNTIQSGIPQAYVHASAIVAELTYIL